MEGSALRGRKHPMKPAVSWHTTLPAKSSVFIPLATADAGKGGVSSQNTTFPVAAEQADFGTPRAEIQDLPRGEIRLFGCR